MPFLPKERTQKFFGFQILKEAANSDPVTVIAELTSGESTEIQKDKRIVRSLQSCPHEKRFERKKEENRTTQKMPLFLFVYDDFSCALSNLVFLNKVNSGNYQRYLAVPLAQTSNRAFCSATGLQISLCRLFDEQYSLHNIPRLQQTDYPMDGVHKQTPAHCFDHRLILNFRVSQASKFAEHAVH